MVYCTVKVVFLVEGDNGKIKKQIENYLVNSMSVEEANIRTVKFLEEVGETREYEIKSVSESKIVGVINEK